MPDKPIPIQIVEMPNGFLEPKDGKNTQVKTGESVIITPEEGATNLEIEFRGKSPFNGKVQYFTEMKIVAPFIKNSSDPSANVYVYDCRFEKNGRKLQTKGGGQFEVLGSEGG